MKKYMALLITLVVSFLSLSSVKTVFASDNFEEVDLYFEVPGATLPFTRKLTKGGNWLFQEDWFYPKLKQFNYEAEGKVSGSSSGGTYSAMRYQGSISYGDIFIQGFSCQTSVHRPSTGNIWRPNAKAQYTNTCPGKIKNRVSYFEGPGIKGKYKGSALDYSADDVLGFQLRNSFSAIGEFYNYESSIEYSNVDSFKFRIQDGEWLTYHKNGLQETLQDDQGTVYLTINHIDIGETNSAISRVTNRRGQSVHYEYSNGNLTKITKPNGEVWTYQYEPVPVAEEVEVKPQDRLVKIIDAKGNETTFTYGLDRWNSYTTSEGEGYRLEVRSLVDNEGKPTEHIKEKIHHDGRVFSRFYDDYKGQLGPLKETRLNGERVSKTTRSSVGGKDTFTRDDGSTYETLVDVKTQIDGKNRKTRIYTRHLASYPYKVQYNDGSIVGYEYSKVGQITKVTSDTGITSFLYDEWGNTTKITEAEGQPEQRVTEFEYDQYGNRTVERYLGDENTKTAVWTYEYDAYGNMTKETDPEGNVTQYKDYDAAGNAWLIIDARGKEWRYEYDALSNRTKAISPKDETTQYFYDERGEYYRRLDPNNAETLYTLDGDGYALKETDGLGQFIEYEYDKGHRVTKFKLQGDTQGAAKKEWQYVYNDRGVISQLVEPLGDVTQYNYSGLDLANVQYPTFSESFGYDKLGRIVESQLSGSRAAQQRRKKNYDSSQNLIAETDAEDNTYTYDYDALGRMISATDPEGGITYYQWDNRDNLIKITDPEGRYFTFEYDLTDQLVKETRHLGQTREYRYYADGLLKTLIDAKGQISQFEYDDAGNLTKTQHFVDATAQANAQPQKVIDYTYNNLSLLTGYNDGTTSAEYVYDVLGQLKEVVVNYGAFSLTHEYDYYPSGLRKSYTSPEGVTYGYIYNANNDLVAVKIPGEGNIIYSNHQWHAPITVTYPGGSQQNYEYDGLLRRLDMILLDPAQNQLAQYDYSYDKEGNLAQISGPEGNYDQTYDNLYRVTSAQLPNPSSVADPANTSGQAETLSQNYQYDGIGNRISQDGVNYQYNENNQLTSQDDGTTRIDYQYDANGSLIKKTVTNEANPDGVSTHYDYDAAGSMVAIRNHNGQTIASYYYDPFGRRLWKETNGQRIYFHYNADGLTGEYNYGNGQLSQMAEYGFTPDGYWMTDPLFTRQNGQVYYYQNDHRGTPTRIITKSGEVVWQAQYDTFGLFYPNKTEIRNPIRMPGQYHDQESDLYYNFARYYDPTLGRYITQDPLGIAGDGPNVYTYGLNNPHTKIDPLGRCSVYGAAAGAVAGMLGSYLAKGCIDWGWVAIGAAVGSCSPRLAATLAARRAAKREARKQAKEALKRDRDKKNKCFVKGTEVHTSEGLKPIEDVEVGDLVVSKDDVTGDVKLKPVVQLFVNHNKPILNLILVDEQGVEEEFGVTQEHPFNIENKGWVNAGDLLVGEKVIGLKDRELFVKSVSLAASLHTTYNFEVADYHSYFVGEIGAWVHNDCEGKTVKEKYRELADKAIAKTKTNANPTVTRNGKDIFRVHKPGSGHGDKVTQSVKNGPPGNKTFPGTKDVNVRTPHLKKLQKALNGEGGYALRYRNGKIVE
ncbi:polymorphic toxin-type HINT domain-containing protein [Litoribrevibacter euphylliae]|uniref:Polymorphic toxin-type HINT domain-containing protein n=1 Tax=Litoribrevibacter euphylliae TaxID=1834034 RepID=A0ABV7HCY1_9GAMM